MSEIDKRIEILADGKTIHGFGMLDLPSVESEIEKISERLKKEKNVPESELRKLYEAQNFDASCVFIRQKYQIFSKRQGKGFL